MQYFSAVAMMNQAQANAAMLRAQHPAAMAAAASMAVALGQFPGGHHPGPPMAMLHGGNMLRPPPMGLPPGMLHCFNPYTPSVGGKDPLIFLLGINS